MEERNDTGKTGGGEGKRKGGNRGRAMLNGGKGGEE